MAEKVWTLRDALAWTSDYFARKGIESPRLSAEWLLSAATGLSRVELYAYHDRPLSPEERASLREAIERRAAGEPLQYVTGEVAFRHLVLKVEPGVFIPRPETEILVDVALEALTEDGSAGQQASGAGELRSATPAAGRRSEDSTGGGGSDERGERSGEPRAPTEDPERSLRADGAPIVIDLCTGSGAVALSIAHEVSRARVYASDLNPVAVRVARENAERAGLAERVTIAEGDLFAPLPAELRGRVDLVVANPPYIPTADLPELPREVAGFEPRLALDGGADGLQTASRIAEEARVWLRPGGTLAMELDESRVKDADRELRAWYEGVRTVRDLATRDRIVVGRLERAAQPG